MGRKIPTIDRKWRNQSCKQVKLTRVGGSEGEGEGTGRIIAQPKSFPSPPPHHRAGNERGFRFFIRLAWRELVHSDPTKNEYYCQAR